MHDPHFCALSVDDHARELVGRGWQNSRQPGRKRHQLGAWRATVILQAGISKRCIPGERTAVFSRYAPPLRAGPPRGGARSPDRSSRSTAAMLRWPEPTLLPDNRAGRVRSRGEGGTPDRGGEDRGLFRQPGRRHHRAAARGRETRAPSPWFPCLGRGAFPGMAPSVGPVRHTPRRCRQQRTAQAATAYPPPAADRVDSFGRHRCRCPAPRLARGRLIGATSCGTSCSSSPISPSACLC